VRRPEAVPQATRSEPALVPSERLSYGSWILPKMERKVRADSPEATSLRFAAAVRGLGSAARALGLGVPAFRSPPRVVGVDRTIRRRPDGGAVVSVRLRDRPWPAVLADMIDGLIKAERLDDFEAGQARRALWSAAVASGLAPAEPATVQTSHPRHSGMQAGAPAAAEGLLDRGAAA